MIMQARTSHGAPVAWEPVNFLQIICPCVQLLPLEGSENNVFLTFTGCEPPPNGGEVRAC